MRASGLLGAVCLLAFQVSARSVSIQPEGHRRRDIPSTHSLHERHLDHQPRLWEKRERADASAVLPMRVGLKQGNLKEGHDRLMDISHPDSPNYGKHLTPEQVVELFAPLKETVEAVVGWLVSSGVDYHSMSRSGNLQWLQFNATVEEAENLLHTDFHIYEHKRSGILNVACSEYYLPDDVREHVDFITPGVKLLAEGHPVPTQDKGLKKRMNANTTPFREESEDASNYRLNTAAADINCLRDVVPTCLRDQYGIPKGTKAHPKNKIGVFQSLGQHYNQDDLNDFFTTYAPDMPNGTHPELRSVNGGLGPTTNRSASGAEAALDFQIVMPIVWPQETVLWQSEDEWYQKDQSRKETIYKGFFNNLYNSMDGSYCKFSAFNETGNCARPECLDPIYPNPAEGGYKGEPMCGVYEPTNIISISYSGAEIDLPYSYIQRQCAEIMKLGLQGITVVVASGDNGVGSFEDDPTPSGCLGPKEDVFNPEFVSDCPYVLAVGATEFRRQRTNGRDAEVFTEVATEGFSSGGGFSNIFPTPEYQQTHVKTYLDVTGPTLGFAGYEGGGTNYSNVGVLPGKFNKLGRATPDVSAVGDGYRIMVRGRWGHIGGTSASAPLWSAILSLINEERLALNKSTIGFPHPVLYTHPEAFNDVVVGSNPNCQTDGFQCAKGWDPVTGLGTPKYPELLAAFLSLP